MTKYGSGTKWGYGEIWRNDRAAGRFQRLEASWNEHTAYIERARDLIEPLAQREVQTLAEFVNVKGQRVAVWNPLPWRRKDIVSVRVPGTHRSLAVTPAGKRGSATSSFESNQLLFVADEVPAMGYSTFELRSEPSAGRHTAQTKGSEPILENAFFKVILDRKRGCIGSITEKHSNRELVDAKAPHGFGQYLYERFSSNQVAAYVKAYVKINADWAVNELGKPSLPPSDQVPYHASTPKDCRLEITNDDLCSAASMQKDASLEIPHAVTTRVLVYKDQPFIDLEIAISGKPADPWPEAGWICIPFNVDKPQFRVGRPGSIIDPMSDIVPGANRDLMAIHTGVAVFDSLGRGAGFCPLDSPLISLGEPGCWKYTVSTLPRRPAVYINLFNNQWTTNFRLWNQGSWTSRVRIWAFDHYSAEESLIRPALEARYPLQAAMADGPAGNLPRTRQGLELGRRGLLVTAFGANPYGAGTLLRLWELAGQSGSCGVRLPEDLKAQSLQPVDLRGQPEGKILPVRNGKFEADFKAFAPATFVITP